MDLELVMRLARVEARAAEAERQARALRGQVRFYRERWLKAAGLIAVEGYDRDGVDVTPHYRRKGAMYG